MMQALLDFVHWEVLLVLTGLALAVVRRVIDAAVGLRGLLDLEGELSASGVQFVFVSILGALVVVTGAVNDPAELSIPEWVVYAFGGSSAIYITRKAGLFAKRPTISKPPTNTKEF